MSKHRKEEVEEEEVAPFWMISFSDLMTLLLSFFIILFSVSTIEVKKTQELMEAMAARYLRGSSAHSGTKAIHADPTQPPARRPAENQHDQPSVAIPSPEPQKHPQTNSTIVPFKLESTELEEEDKQELARLAERWRGMPTPITVKGHASNNEKSRQVVDDLAYERAWNVREYFLTLGLERKRFSLVIVGPNEPLNEEAVPLSSRFGDANTYVEVFMRNE